MKIKSEIVPTKETIVINKRVAVVILSYNGREYLQKFLPALIATDYDDFEIVIVDNASTDDTTEFIKNTYPDIKLLKIDINKGFTNGYVYALSLIKSEYYVLLSVDVEVTPGWIKPIIELMDKDKKIAACQPKVKSYHNKRYFEYSGAAGGYIDWLGYPFCRGRIFHEIEEDLGQYNDIKEIFWATGACLFIRSEIYHSVNGFDNDFYAHMEDIDLCWRIKKHGFKIMVVPQSQVYHVGGSIIYYGSPAKIYHNFRNGLIILIKNLSKIELLYTLPIRILLDYIAVIRAIFLLHFQESFAIIRAHSSFIFNMIKWIGKRKEISSSVSKSKVSCIYQKSIIFDFFVKKVKKFNEITFE